VEEVREEGIKGRRGLTPSLASVEERKENTQFCFICIVIRERRRWRSKSK